MKRLFWLSPVAILATLWMIGLGCTTNNNPVAPPTWTPVPNTPTSTKTNTATVAVTSTATNTVASTSTDTATPTATNTAQATATDTATGTSTDTATDTVTETPTDTATNTATNTPTNTATSTPGLPETITTFEGSGSGSNAYWYLNYCPCGSVAVTALGHSGSYGFDLIFNNNTCNDFQAAVSDATYGFPLDFSAWGATGVKAWVYANPNAFVNDTGEWIVACPFLVANGVSYGGDYNGWANANPTQLPNPGGSWVQVTLAPAGGSWATDESSVTKIGVEINMGTGSSQPPNTDFVIDDIEIY